MNRRDDRRDGQIVTFYSYKGGVGRTFALANIAAQLTKWGYKVLCVDWDLEAPGLEKYFFVLEERKSSKDLIDLLVNPRIENNWRNHVSTYQINDSEKEIGVIRAGSDHKEYVKAVQELDWDKLYREKELGAVLENMRDQWKEEYDFTLIDSRTGITDIGGICTVQMPDILVPLVTANHQNFEGANEVVKRVIAARDELEFDRGGLLVLPILSRFDSREEYEQAKRWRVRFRESFEWTFEPWKTKELVARDLVNYLTIPYFSYWSFGERLPVVEEEHAPPESISYSFQTITAVIASNLEAVSSMIRNRDSYVSGVLTKRERNLGYDVYVSYSHSESGLAARMSQALQAEQLKVFLDRDSVGHGDWREQIEAGFKQTRLVLFLMSETSKTQLTEMMLAEENDAHTVFVLIGDNKRVLNWPTLEAKRVFAIADIADELGINEVVSEISGLLAPPKPKVAINLQMSFERNTAPIEFESSNGNRQRINLSKTTPFVWIAITPYLKYKDELPNDIQFVPAIIDTGSTSDVVLHQWHLEHWLGLSVETQTVARNVYLFGTPMAQARLDVWLAIGEQHDLPQNQPSVKLATCGTVVSTINTAEFRTERESRPSFLDRIMFGGKNDLKVLDGWLQKQDGSDGSGLKGVFPRIPILGLGVLRKNKLEFKISTQDNSYSLSESKRYKNV